MIINWYGMFTPIACKFSCKASAKPYNKHPKNAPTGLYLPKIMIAKAAYPFSDDMFSIKVLDVAIDKYAPAIAAIAPVTSTLIKRYLTTGSPKVSTACGFSPTALHSSPKAVFSKKNQVARTKINEKYTRTFWLKNTSPTRGILLSIGNG